jgi:hypothetical protein
MNFIVELEQEEDGRWIAEVVDIPGVLAYGQSQQEALARAQARSAEKYPRGWNEARVRRVLEYYESQSDEEAAAEIETAFESTTMEVPVALVPEVRRLIAKRKWARPTTKQNTTLQPRSRTQRRSKAQRNSRAARG